MQNEAFDHQSRLHQHEAGALRRAEKLLQENLEHDAAALQQYHGIGDQVPMRLAVIRDFLDRSGVHPEELAAVIGRGGLVFGLKTGRLPCE